MTHCIKAGLAGTPFRITQHHPMLGAQKTDVPPLTMKGPFLQMQQNFLEAKPSFTERHIQAKLSQVYKMGGAANDCSLSIAGRSDGNNSSPGEIGCLWPLGIVQIACGDNHSVVLTVDGRVFSWGRGKYGQLGLGNFENSLLPTEVELKAFVIQVYAPPPPPPT